MNVKDLSKGLRVLAVTDELKEVLAVLNGKGVKMNREPLRLVYKGQMKWSKQYGIDSRMWDVVSPRLSTYDYSSGGYPTLTTEGLKQVGILKWF
jgi:hypothetical protein